MPVEREQSVSQSLRAERRVTLKDVALLAGCSSALVSTVINRSNTNAGASPALTRRIMKAAEKLNYRADFASQSLARRSTRTIGVYVTPDVCSSLTYPYESAILHGVEKVCQQNGYDLLAINLTGAASPEGCFHKFTERRIDGLVLLRLHHHTPWLAPLIERFPKVVGVNFHGDLPDLRRVNFDDQAAIALAVKHLTELGHRRIGYLGPGSREAGPGAMLRRTSFEQAMRAEGLWVPPAWVWDTSNPAATTPDRDVDLPTAGNLGVSALFAGHARPTALVCYSDLSAIYAVRRLQQMGLNVPGDVSVIGIDDMELCRHVSPSLSSIRQPLEEMGRRATQMLFESPSNHATSATDDLLELVVPQLVVRESTGMPPDSLGPSYGAGSCEPVV